MFSCRGLLARTHLFVLLFTLTVPASPSFAQASPTPHKALQFLDSTHVAAVACQVAAATRPKGTGARCHVEAIGQTPSEFIVRIRETPLAPTTTLDFPRSEVRLRKDGTGALLTRMPEL
jgi:hypothetical protein